MYSEAANRRLCIPPGMGLRPIWGGKHDIETGNEAGDDRRGSRYRRDPCERRGAGDVAPRVVVLGAIVYVAVSRLKRESGRATAEPEVMAPVAVPTHAPEAEPVVAADTPTPQPEVSASGSPAADQQAATGSAGADMAGDVRLGTLLPGETEVSERKGNWRYNG